jgi:hypothetical protein
MSTHLYVHTHVKISVYLLPFDFVFLKSPDDDFLNMRPLLLYGRLNCMGSKGRASAIVRTPVSTVRVKG